MNIEEIDKWLDNEYGTSYTRLEELHDYFFEKYTDQKEEIERLNKENTILRENAKHNDKVVDKVNWENKRLNNIIKEVREHNQYIIDVINDIESGNRLVELLNENNEILNKVDRNE